MQHTTQTCPARPRRTEEVAREALVGLLYELLDLRRSNEPMAWDRIAEIGQEMTLVAETTAFELRRRAGESVEARPSSSWRRTFPVPEVRG